MRKKLIVIQLLCSCLFLTGNITLNAQSDNNKTISTSVSVDLVSQYIWRGQDYGQKPSIQPEISASWKNFTIGYWGAYKFSGPGEQEIDFYIQKKIGPATLTVYDYWSLSDVLSKNYFNYTKQNTSHILEVQLELSGGEKLPFNLIGGYNFYGADTSKSVYFEMQYLKTYRAVELQVFTGFQARGDYYADKSSFVNLGCAASYPIKLSQTWSIPLNLSFVLNPASKDVYFVGGITLLNL